MEREGLWRLFFATGLPEVYLALRDEERRGIVPPPDCLTAFRAEDQKNKRLT